MDRRGILAAIVWFSIRFHGVVIAVACLLMAYGIYSLPSAKSDVFPEFAPPRVKIQTESPGLAPEQVETLVTTPIENAIVGVPGIESVYSTSIQGLSLIKLTFHWTSDIYLDRQLVTELFRSERLPPAPQSDPLVFVLNESGPSNSCSLHCRTDSLPF